VCQVELERELEIEQQMVVVLVLVEFPKSGLKEEPGVLQPQRSEGMLIKRAG
jgi:hypothetical protein